MCERVGVYILEMSVYTPSTNRGGQLSRTIVASICAGASVQNALVSVAEVFGVVSLSFYGASWEETKTSKEINNWAKHGILVNFEYPIGIQIKSR